MIIWGKEPEGVPFLCSASYPVVKSFTLGFIWDSMLIKPKQMQVRSYFPLHAIERYVFLLRKDKLF